MAADDKKRSDAEQSVYDKLLAETRKASSDWARYLIEKAAHEEKWHQINTHFVVSTNEYYAGRRAVKRALQEPSRGKRLAEALTEAKTDLKELENACPKSRMRTGIDG